MKKLKLAKSLEKGGAYKRDIGGGSPKKGKGRR